MSSDLGTIFGSGGLVISIISMIYAAINHKRIRAKCCGRSLDFEINIDSTEEAGAKKGGAGTGVGLEYEYQSIDVPTPTPPPKNIRPPTPLSFDTLRRIQMFGKKKATVAPVAEEPASAQAPVPAPIRVKPHRKWAADEDDDDAELR
jgi:hypothetical protein